MCRIRSLYAILSLKYFAFNERAILWNIFSKPCVSKGVLIPIAKLWWLFIYESDLPIRDEVPKLDLGIIELKKQT